MKDPRFAEHLSVFVDVVRGGSFSSAARRRSQSPSAVVRQIDALEHDLGVTLLARSTRALALTDAGQHLFDRAQRLLDDLADTRAEIAAFDGAVAGTLRIACFPTFGKRYVIPTIDALMEQHPRLKVELDLTERLADPVIERLDAVIRIGTLSDSTLIATKIAEQRRLLVAAPRYFARASMPAAIDDLCGHRILDKLHGNDLLGWREILGDVGSRWDGGEVAFRSDDFEALRSAALRGLGIALLPDWVVGDDVRDGHLVRLTLGDEAWNADPAAISLLRALQDPPAKVRAFAAALRSNIGTPPRWRP